MTTRGIEAIKYYLPPTKTKIQTNIKEERCISATYDKTIVDEAATAMTSVERYKQEWKLLLEKLNADPESIRDAAFNGELKVSKFRSVYWALLLRVLNADYSCWRQQRSQQRSRYEKFKVDFVHNPHNYAENPDDNPLSQSTKSIWNQYFGDQELFGIIRQDVVRTFPGVDFFRKPLIQHAMVNILFYYAREHPYMCYRQGMHEILAPIIFVLFGDHQSLLHFKEIVKTDINDTLLDVINPQYLEADTYSIFSRLMCSVESYYRITHLFQTSMDDMDIESSNNLQAEVEIIGQLNRIRDKILAKEDLHLHNYLLKLDIPLHIFGIRWLRLLFGREFPLLDLLMLWDAIFADSDRFDLPNYILVAMLVHIRDKLLLSDYTTALTYLMRYPTNADVSLVLRHSLHMLYPKKFPRPVNAYAFISFNNIAAQQTTLNAALSSTVSTRKQTKQEPSVSTAKSSPTQELTQKKTTSSRDNSNNMDKQITSMQVQNAATASVIEKLRQPTEAARVVMDGYSLNSPELLRLELQNAQTVIKIARSKLQKYLSTVRKHLAQHNNDELENTLDGMEELCNLLDVQLIFPLQSRSTHVDQALEANEVQQQPKQKQNPMNANNVQIAEVLNPVGNRLSLHKNYNNGVTYEKPESAIMYNPARKLGNMRDIELLTIASVEKPSSMQAQSNGLPVANPLDAK